MSQSSILEDSQQELELSDRFLWLAVAGEGEVLFIPKRAESNSSRTLDEEMLRKAQTMHLDLTAVRGAYREKEMSYELFYELFTCFPTTWRVIRRTPPSQQPNADHLKGFLIGSGEALLGLGPDLLVAIGGCNTETAIGDPYLPFGQALVQLQSLVQIHAIDICGVSLPEADPGDELPLDANLRV